LICKGEEERGKGKKGERDSVPIDKKPRRNEGGHLRRKGTTCGVISLVGTSQKQVSRWVDSV